MEATTGGNSFAKVAIPSYIPNVLVSNNENVALNRPEYLSADPRSSELNDFGEKRYNLSKEAGCFASTSQLNKGINQKCHARSIGLTTNDKGEAGKAFQSDLALSSNTRDIIISPAGEPLSVTLANGGKDIGSSAISMNAEAVSTELNCSIKGKETLKETKTSALPSTSKISGFIDPDCNNAQHKETDNKTHQSDIAPKMSQFVDAQALMAPLDMRQTSTDRLPMSASASHGYDGPSVIGQPDEKLLLALQSPRDRMFILKLEQDIIKFIENSSEMSIGMPQSNSFHRLLTHRLADYYLLGHTVDSGLGAVRLHRTPYCRLTQPLAIWAKTVGLSENQHSAVQTRMIMRRDDIIKPQSNSLNEAEILQDNDRSSKDTAEIAADISKDGSLQASQNSTKKLLMTREEREAKYIEARQRIFGAAEETMSGGSTDDSKGVSSSSSSNGKKRLKKQKEDQDDGFEARSQYNAIYPPSVPYGHPNELYYLQNFPIVAHSSGYNLNSDAQTSMSSSSRVMSDNEFMNNVTWTVPDVTLMGRSIHNIVHDSSSSAYDLSGDFQRNLQICQPSSFSNHPTAKSPTALGPQTYDCNDSQGQTIQPSWYCSSNSNLSHTPLRQAAANLTMSTISSTHPQHYPYGKLPDNPLSYGKTNHDQHPIPGSYNRQQFNPHSQTFVPTTRNSASRKGYNESTKPSVATSTASPRGTYSASNHITKSSSSSSVSSFNGRQGSISSLNVNAHGLSHPLPQPVLVPNVGHSSIAKWGTPAHLPPKPPPPALFTSL